MSELMDGTVLVANMDLHFGAAVALHLTELGCTVVSAASGQEALERCESLRPQALLTSLDGGDEDTFEFVEAVTARMAAAGLPRPGVLVCTRQPGLRGLGAETWSLLGIDLVVERPCRLDAVADALRGLLAAPTAPARYAEGERDRGADEASAARFCAHAEVAR